MHNVTTCSVMVIVYCSHTSAISYRRVQEETQGSWHFHRYCGTVSQTTMYVQEHMRRHTDFTFRYAFTVQFPLQTCPVSRHKWYFTPHFWQQVRRFQKLDVKWRAASKTGGKKPPNLAVIGQEAASGLER